MKNTTKLIGFAVIATVMVCTMTVVACDDGSNTPKIDDNDLPAASGANDVSGKMYYESINRTAFSATVAGDASGTYTKSLVDNGEYASNDKFTYNNAVIETGKYTWNETAKTITLKPESVVQDISYIWSTSPMATTTVEHELGQLEDIAAVRISFQAMIDELTQGMTQEQIDAMLSAMGFASIAEIVDAYVNENFSILTYSYSFSADNKSLFLEISLPAGKGANELSGNTYYGLTFDNQDDPIQDTNMQYIFTVSGYTSTNTILTESVKKTGTYTWDSTGKKLLSEDPSKNKGVLLKPSTVNDQTREEYYTALTASSGHHFADDDAYKAAQTNNIFNYRWQPYDVAIKTLGWGAYYAQSGTPGP